MATEYIRIVVAEDGSRVVKRRLEDLGGAGETAAKGVQFLTRALAALGLAMGVRELIEQVDTYTLLTNRLKLVTTGVDNLRRVQDELFQSAQRTRSGLEGTVDLYSRIARNAKALGLSQQEILDVTETVNQAIRVSGTSAQEAAAGIVQLGQALGSGSLRGDELNSILENMPRLAQAIADGMGVTIGQLRKLGADGKLTSQEVVEALQKSAPEIAKEFAQLTPTIGEAFTVMSNSALRFIGELDQTLGISRTVATALIALGNNLDTVAKAAGVVAVTLGTLATLNIATNIAAAVGQLIALERALGAANVASAALGAGLKLVQGGAQAAAAAMALVGGPITLVIALITAIIAALYIFRDDIKVAADGVVSLGDVFRAIFAYIMDVVGPVIDWFREAWSSGLESVTGWFGDFLRAVVDIGAKILDFYKKAVNTYIGVWVGAAKAVIIAWNNFGPAMEAIGVGAINGLIDVVDSGLKMLVRGIGDFIEWLGGAFTAVGLENPFAGMLDDFETGMEGLKLTASKEAADIGKSISDAFTESVNYDYLGNTVGAVMDRARQIADARIAAESAGTAAPLMPGGPAAPVVDTGAGGKLPDALKRQKEMLEQIRGPMEDYQKNVQALDSLLAKGKISVDEYETAFRDLRITLLDTKTTLEAGMERAFLKIAKDASDAASQIEDLIDNAFSNATDALVDFVKTGKLDFSNFIDSLISDLLRLVLQQQIIAPLANALSGLTGGIGSFFSGLFGAATGGTMSVGQTGLGFATAGDFTVPGQSGAVDSVPVSFMASPGEKVKVTRPGEVEKGSGQTIQQNVQVNVIGGNGNAEVEERQGSDGSRIIDVFIDRSKAATANDIASGGSELNRAIERRYGLNPAAGNVT